MKIRPVNVHGKKRWCLDARDIGQKRQTFKSKAMAEAEMEVLSGQRKAAGDVWLALSHTERNELISVFHEVQQAGMSLREMWQKFKTGESTKPKIPKTLREAITETIAAKKQAKRRGGYIDGLECYLDAFAKGRDAMQVSSFGVAEIEQWFESRREGAATQRSNLGRLSALFDLCWRRHYIFENPCWRIELPSIDRKTPAVLTLAQAADSMSWVHSNHPKFLAWMTLALFVGLRPEAEADNIDWSVIDIKRKRIRIEGDSTKVRSHRIIDLSLCPPALAWLKRAKKLKSPLEMSYSTRRRHMRRLREHLGFKSWPQDILRHTAASNLLAHHQDAGKIAAFLGNSAGTLLRDYKALIFKEDAEKFMNLIPKKGNIHKPVSAKS